MIFWTENINFIIFLTNSLLRKALPVQELATRPRKCSQPAQMAVSATVATTLPKWTALLGPTGAERCPRTGGAIGERYRRQLKFEILGGIFDKEIIQINWNSRFPIGIRVLFWDMTCITRPLHKGKGGEMKDLGNKRFPVMNSLWIFFLKNDQFSFKKSKKKFRDPCRSHQRPPPKRSGKTRVVWACV